MRWYFYVSYFFGGVFLVNAVPHFVNGVSGRSFPTPFASPPGKGKSSPLGCKLAPSPRYKSSVTSTWRGMPYADW